MGRVKKTCREDDIETQSEQVGQDIWRAWIRHLSNEHRHIFSE